MPDVISDVQRRARKEHWCDSCLRKIRPGELYWAQFHTEGSFKEHTHCRIASETVAADLEWIDLGDGMPRVCDMEQEDREHIAAVAPDAYVMIWGDG